MIGLSSAANKKIIDTCVISKQFFGRYKTETVFQKCENCKSVHHHILEEAKLQSPEFLDEFEDCDVCELGLKQSSSTVNMRSVKNLIEVDEKTKCDTCRKTSFTGKHTTHKKTNTWISKKL